MVFFEKIAKLLETIKVLWRKKYLRKEKEKKRNLTPESSLNPLAKKFTSKLMSLCDGEVVHLQRKIE
jgi:hypothetical protein